MGRIYPNGKAYVTTYGSPENISKRNAANASGGVSQQGGAGGMVQMEEVQGRIPDPVVGGTAQTEETGQVRAPMTCATYHEERLSGKAPSGSRTFDQYSTIPQSRMPRSITQTPHEGRGPNEIPGGEFRDEDTPIPPQARTTSVFGQPFPVRNEEDTPTAGIPGASMGYPDDEDGDLVGDLERLGATTVQAEENYPYSPTFAGAPPVPQAKTPDPNVSATTYGNIPKGLDVVYGQTKPTAEQAAGAGTRRNFPSGTYPANPTPMQGPGDNRATQAVMPKIQVQGNPRTTYGIKTDSDFYDTPVGAKARDQTNVNPRQNPPISQNPPAKIPNSRGASGSSEVFRTTVGVLYDPTKSDEFQELKCLNCGLESRQFEAGSFVGRSVNFTKSIDNKQYVGRCIGCRSEAGFIPVGTRHN